jgi:integrase
MALGKQAKIISDKQVRAVLAELDTRRYPLRDRVIFMFSLKAGMRAKEIASVTWSMVTDAVGPRKPPGPVRQRTEACFTIALRRCRVWSDAGFFCTNALSDRNSLAGAAIRNLAHRIRFSSQTPQQHLEARGHRR